MRARDFRARASGPRLTSRYACTVRGSARGVKRRWVGKYSIRTEPPLLRTKPEGSFAGAPDTRTRAR